MSHRPLPHACGCGLVIVMNPMNDETLAALQDAGLTQYQARAYVTLLQTGTVRVLPLSRASGVPRNKLYHVLADLEKDGLVEVSRREPLEYRALPLRPYLEARIGRLQALLHRFDGMAATWAPAPASAPAHAPHSGTHSAAHDAEPESHHA